MFIRRSTVWKRQLCRRDPPIFVPKYLPKVVVQPPPLHTHLLYERFHDWPHLPLVTLSFPRTRLECCGLVGVWLNSLLQSHVAMLSPQLRCELLESMTGSPVSLITQRLCTELHSAERPSKGCCLVLTVMFLPECWTPGPTKPQLKLHKKLVGYKMQMYSTVGGPSFCYLSGHFQKVFLHFTI